MRLMTCSRSCLFVLVLSTIIIYVIVPTEVDSTPIPVAEVDGKQIVAEEAEVIETDQPQTDQPETEVTDMTSPEAEPKATAAEVINPEQARETRATEVEMLPNPLDGRTPPDDGGPLQLRDVIHTVKTSRLFHQTRVEPILLTWFKQTPEQTYFITDGADLALTIRTNQHLVTSSCIGDHGPYGLSCKMNLEFDEFVKRDGKWWCHWDDDNYVNLKLLLPLLDSYDWREPWYLGKASVDRTFDFRYNKRDYTARFAHGGCGFCLSRALVKMMVPYAYAGRLLDFSRQTQANDDVVVGFIINGILKVNLTHIEEFNSHYHWERLINMKNEQLPRQISLSYSQEYHVTIRPPVRSFSHEDDPSRFYSIHCMNYPELEYCKYLPEKSPAPFSVD